MTRHGGGEKWRVTILASHFRYRPETIATRPVPRERAVRDGPSASNPHGGGDQPVVFTEQSPNKDRPASRSISLHRYLSYLQEGVHLLLVDVHRRPVNFSFANALDQELHISLPPLPAPQAIAYRVGEPAPQGGRLVAIWRRTLSVGQPLPTMPLPLTVHTAIPVNLEETYLRATANAYLD